jgi:transcriptional regulator with XRE-family HTH domain
MAKESNPIDVKVGNRIRSQRLMRGLSQTALAEACGITFQQVQKYEKGTNRVSASRMMQIAQILGTTASSFFGENDHKSKQNADIELIKSADVLRPLRAFDRIPPGKVRASLIAHIEALAREQ